MLISIIIPTYNEEENIPEFYNQVSPILDALPYQWEMIFVNDGSRDQSAGCVAALHEKDRRGCLVGLGRKFGSYSAIRAGVLPARGGGIVCISFDLQGPPERIPEFIKARQGGAEIVWGVR